MRYVCIWELKNEEGKADRTSTLFPLISFLMIPLYRGPLSVIIKTFGLVFSHVLPRLPLHLYHNQTTLATLHRSPVAQSSFVGILI